MIVFLLEALVGGLAYVYESNVATELADTLNDTFTNGYAVDRSQTIAIDRMQQEVNHKKKTNKKSINSKKNMLFHFQYICCGAFRFEDWKESVWLRSRRKDLLKTKDKRLVPDSCCITMTEKCGLRDHPSNIPYTGCIYKFSDDLRDHLNILAAVGSGICVVQIFGMVLACCLYIKLKDVDQ